MKIAVYIDEGRTQLVLTPESGWEKNIINSIDIGQGIMVYRGTFYDCLGGWTRWKNEPESMILVMNKPDEKGSLVQYEPAEKGPTEPDPEKW